MYKTIFISLVTSFSINTTSKLDLHHNSHSISSATTYNESKIKTKKKKIKTKMATENKSQVVGRMTDRYNSHRPVFLETLGVILKPCFCTSCKYIM